MYASATSLALTVGFYLCLTLLCSNSRSASQSYRVEYEVTGEGGANAASVTYRNATDGTEQQEIALPWTRDLTVPSGSFLYLSAQNKSQGGTITTSIYVNGKMVKESVSTGPHVIATASYSCCE